MHHPSLSSTLLSPSNSGRFIPESEITCQVEYPNIRTEPGRIITRRGVLEQCMELWNTGQDGGLFQSPKSRVKLSTPIFEQSLKDYNTAGWPGVVHGYWGAAARRVIRMTGPEDIVAKEVRAPVLN
ncbi:hypothetical protein CEXT_678751 [Caerostris extrusa]|uniref:Uncharacterized protein n=1 Tax=Caerostris extrusa TaxID=172846 RepID=A0AAV4RN01_CAEEX|nr:hypothetical protein CEXT_678751 [Caerostris extrusa]